ncbi:CHAT domain-containing protein [Dactylosporangium sp. NPDC049525]|uniref:CHAT domain-containing protein n=1 Tax=Dactylosporangium sp. NPDC049525 TaxID=3154730 RepID=UPI003439FBAF
MTSRGGDEFTFNGPVQHNGPTAYGTNAKAIQGAPGARPLVPDGSSRIRILWLAANPLSTARLALDEEAREVTEKLRLARDREVFELITRWAVRPADLLQHLNEHRPHVVHFSGHGDSTGMIALSAGEGNSRPVTTAALAEMFRIVRNEVRIVVLNACYSDIQAQAIGQHIDHVVGMRRPIDDRSAAIFAAAFYSALGFGRSVHEAFEQGKTALMLHDMPDHDVPNLLTRAGADPFVVVT